MPLITITSLKGRTAEEKQKIGEAVHAAIVEGGVPPTDRFQRFLDLEPENFLYDKYYPNLENGRTENFVIIEILLSVGRSVKVKRKILETLITKLQDLSFNPEDVFVSFQETAWENWSFAKGEILHA
ncbi:tautomerase family protein [Chryseobacterium polytrichastri]|uniref:Tautomerase enzyme n=1 Tax=Chryseobacterium polytrichastri TaxID=1302687 RepID=A0A1M7GEP0_9FLAO|nr:tautomerase family protein [Chryseobacterium polytrichastri]SHM14626.1 Tautomerase enzyme [Chryseobacterium polytrichastri]